MQDEWQLPTGSAAHVRLEQRQPDRDAGAVQEGATIELERTK